MATTNTRNTKGTTNIGEIIRVIKAYENYTTEQCRDLIAEAKHEGPEARAKALEYCGDMISQFGLFKSLLAELLQSRRRERSLTNWQAKCPRNCKPFGMTTTNSRKNRG